MEPRRQWELREGVRLAPGHTAASLQNWGSNRGLSGSSAALAPGPQAACSGRALNDARWSPASFEVPECSRPAHAAA